MANRHQRRKAAKAKALAKAEGLAMAERSKIVSGIVRNNLAKPIERDLFLGVTKNGNHRPMGCAVANVKGHPGFVSNHYSEPRAGGGMSKRSIQALQAKGATFSRADMLSADEMARLGEHLSGRLIRKEQSEAFQAKLKAIRARMGKA